jgi:hypothetical protein
MSYILPQALVFQEVRALQTAVIEPLRAMIFGPNYDLKRYTDEKSEIGLGAYNPDLATEYAWPDRPVGGVVDTAWTRLFMDDAWLFFWTNPSPALKDLTVHNRVRAAGINFVTYKSWARDASLRDRDVKVGDGVRIRGGAEDILTWVTGFINDTVAASTGSASADADNQAPTVANATVNQTGGTVNDITTTVDGLAYNGMVSGYIEETYTVTVAVGSTGGDATTARLTVTSASGTDNLTNVVPAAFASDTDIGTRGLTVAFDHTSDELVVGQVFTVTVRQTYAVTTPTAAGTYTGPSDSTYIVTVATGGALAASPTLMVTTTNGVDTGGPYTVTGSGVPVAIGSYGVTIAFAGGTGLVKGDRFIIPVVAQQAGAIKTLVLANKLPTSLDGVNLTVDLFIRKNIEVSHDRTGFAPLTNFEAAATKITVNPGIVAYDSTWYDSLGNLTAMPVYKGSMFVQYRSLLQTYATHIYSISDVAEITQLGAISRDNPLALAVYKALLNANGTDVKFMAVPTNDVAGYTAVLNQLVGRDDTYGLVPLTYDRTVQDMVAAHVKAMSTAENGRWRLAWLNSMATEEQGIVTVDGEGDPTMATVKDPDLGSNFVYVESDNGLFLTNGVKAGDVFRVNYASDGFGNWTYEEYLVDSVISEDSLRLYSGPSAAINVPSKFEIWRNLTKDEVAQAFAQISGSFGDRRVRHVWPDWITSAGTTMEGIFLCAALAGLRSGVAPHQGLTNVEIAGFDKVERSTDYFGGSQLNIMAEAGTWIVTQNIDTGVVYTRHQLTTGEYANLNAREDSITTNLDSISYYMLNAFAPYIGRSNVSPAFVDQLETDYRARLDELKIVRIDSLGPQVISYTVDEFRQHTVLKDRVVAVSTLELPAPFNNFEMHLVI